MPSSIAKTPIPTPAAALSLVDSLRFNYLRPYATYTTAVSSSPTTNQLTVLPYPFRFIANCAMLTLALGK